MTHPESTPSSESETLLRQMAKFYREFDSFFKKPEDGGRGLILHPSRLDPEKMHELSREPQLRKLGTLLGADVPCIMLDRSGRRCVGLANTYEYLPSGPAISPRRFPANFFGLATTVADYPSASDMSLALLHLQEVRGRGKSAAAILRRWDCKLLRRYARKFEKDGEVNSLLGTVEDIADRVNAAKAIKLWLDSLPLLVENAKTLRDVDFMKYLSTILGGEDYLPKKFIEGRERTVEVTDRDGTVSEVSYHIDHPLVALMKSDDNLGETVLTKFQDQFLEILKNHPAVFNKVVDGFLTSVGKEVLSKQNRPDAKFFGGIRNEIVKRSVFREAGTRRLLTEVRSQANPANYLELIAEKFATWNYVKLLVAAGERDYLNTVINSLLAKSLMGDGTGQTKEHVGNKWSFQQLEEMFNSGQNQAILHKAAPDIDTDSQVSAVRRVTQAADKEGKSELKEVLTGIVSTQFSEVVKSSRFYESYASDLASKLASKWLRARAVGKQPGVLKAFVEASGSLDYFVTIAHSLIIYGPVDSFLQEAQQKLSEVVSRYDSAQLKDLLDVINAVGSLSGGKQKLLLEPLWAHLKNLAANARNVSWQEETGSSLDLEQSLGDVAPSQYLSKLQQFLLSDPTVAAIVGAQGWTAVKSEVRRHMAKYFAKPTLVTGSRSGSRWGDYQGQIELVRSYLTLDFKPETDGDEPLGDNVVDNQSVRALMAEIFLSINNRRKIFTPLIRNFFDLEELPALTSKWMQMNGLKTYGLDELVAFLNNHPYFKLLTGGDTYALLTGAHSHFADRLAEYYRGELSSMDATELGSLQARLTEIEVLPAAVATPLKRVVETALSQVENPENSYTKILSHLKQMTCQPGNYFTELRTNLLEIQQLIEKADSASEGSGDVRSILNGVLLQIFQSAFIDLTAEQYCALIRDYFSQLGYQSGDSTGNFPFASTVHNAFLAYHAMENTRNRFIEHGEQLLFFDSDTGEPRNLDPAAVPRELLTFFEKNPLFQYLLKNDQALSSHYKQLRQRIAARWAEFFTQDQPSLAETNTVIQAINGINKATWTNTVGRQLFCWVAVEFYETVFTADFTKQINQELITSYQGKVAQATTAQVLRIEAESALGISTERTNADYAQVLRGVGPTIQIYENAGKQRAPKDNRAYWFDLKRGVVETGARRISTLSDEDKEELLSTLESQETEPTDLVILMVRRAINSFPINIIKGYLDFLYPRDPNKPHVDRFTAAHYGSVVPIEVVLAATNQAGVFARAGGRFNPELVALLGTKIKKPDWIFNLLEPIDERSIVDMVFTPDLLCSGLQEEMMARIKRELMALLKEYEKYLEVEGGAGGSGEQLLSTAKLPHHFLLPLLVGIHRSLLLRQLEDELDDFSLSESIDQLQATLTALVRDDGAMIASSADLAQAFIAKLDEQWMQGLSEETSQLLTLYLYSPDVLLGPRLQHLFEMFKDFAKMSPDEFRHASKLKQLISITFGVFPETGPMKKILRDVPPDVMWSLTLTTIFAKRSDALAHLERLLPGILLPREQGSEIFEGAMVIYNSRLEQVDFAALLQAESDLDLKKVINSWIGLTWEDDSEGEVGMQNATIPQLVYHHRRMERGKSEGASPTVDDYFLWEIEHQVLHLAAESITAKARDYLLRLYQDKLIERQAATAEQRVAAAKDLVDRMAEELKSSTTLAKRLSEAVATLPTASQINGQASGVEGGLRQAMERMDELRQILQQDLPQEQLIARLEDLLDRHPSGVTIQGIIEGDSGFGAQQTIGAVMAQLVQANASFIQEFQQEIGRLQAAVMQETLDRSERSEDELRQRLEPITASLTNRLQSLATLQQEYQTALEEQLRSSETTVAVELLSSDAAKKALGVAARACTYLADVAVFNTDTSLNEDGNERNYPSNKASLAAFGSQFVSSFTPKELVSLYRQQIT